MQSSCLRALVLAVALAFTSSGKAAESGTGIAILPAVAWSPGDSIRDGAGEFEVLLRVAQLRRTHHSAGLISVGDRHGMRPGGAERALLRVTLTGVPVVKLAPHGEVATSPEGVFLDGGGLSVEMAGHILARCLEAHGAPPAVTNADSPTRRELAAIRSHLQPFQTALTAAATARIAAR